MAGQSYARSTVTAVFESFLLVIRALDIAPVGVLGCEAYCRYIYGGISSGKSGPPV